MFGLVKIAGISALLSAGIVTIYELPQAHRAAPVPGKMFTDRIAPADARALASVQALRGTAPDESAAGPMLQGKGDRLWTDAGHDCAAQAWPHIARDCLTATDGTPIRTAVRTITIESREGANVSLLARVPVAEVAQR